MDKLLIVDGNSIANRAFYALPYLTNFQGKASGAVFGFANILIKIISEQKPTHIAVAFDHARQTFRNQIYADYKGQRKPTPPELVEQFPVIKQMLDTMGIKTFEFENIEADDIIGTIASRTQCEKIILSGDRDLLQLINPSTYVWLTKKGVSEVSKMGLAELKKEFLLEPYQIIELKGLMGDTSDNIPGVKGVGEKTAKELLERYQNIDNIYNNIDNISGKLKEKLIDGRDDAYLSKELATICQTCSFDFDLDKCKLVFPFSSDVVDFFKAWDFSSLLKNPNLFSNIVIEREVQSVRKEITEEILATLLKSAPKVLAYNLKKMCLAVDEKTVYFLNGNYDMFGSALSMHEVCQTLKPLFEDSRVLKITLSAKEDLHTLESYGIKLNNYYDLKLASYINSAGIKTIERDIEPTQYLSLKADLDKKMKEEGTMTVYSDIELPLIEILKDMESNGFKINTEKIDELDLQFSNELNNFTNRIYYEAGEEFNINSPKQVAHILYDKLGIKTWNNKKQSTSSDILDEVRYIPIVDNILRYRKLAKLKNTYIDVYKAICQQSGDIIHTTFNQALTSTGRLSSSEPNLQNIPTRDDEGRELRKLFESKFAGGGLFSADYNQIELRLLAHMSGEEKLIEAYKEGKDIHTITASEIFGIDEKAVEPNQRREAKAVNFGIIYGISDYGLSQNIKSTRQQAKSYIDSYFERYPKVKSLMDGNVERATADGYIKTMFGRIRKIPELNSSKYQTRTFGQRVAMNMPLQGTASDIIKMAMLRVYNALKKENLKSQLILQIHDELIIDTYPSEEKQVENILKTEMENVVSLKIPLVVSISYGKNLYDCK